MEYNNLEQAYIDEGTEKGDSFRKVVRVKAVGDSGVTEFVSFKRGTVEEERRSGGDRVLIDSVEESMSLGQIDLIDDMQDALGELSEKIED
jgi:hypothetical protein